MKPAVGRPRDPRIDDAVLPRPPSWSSEVGYADADGGRGRGHGPGPPSPRSTGAGPARPTWCTRRSFPSGEPVSLPRDRLPGRRPAGDAAADLRGVHAPVARAALPGLVGESPRTRRCTRRCSSGSGGVFADLGDRLGQAAERGEVRPGARPRRRDRALAGAALLALLIGSADALDDAWVERTADLLLKESRHDRVRLHRRLARAARQAARPRPAVPRRVTAP